MSFSKDVKEELSAQYSSARHCCLAELAAMLSYEGRIVQSGSKYYLKIQTENIDVARKYFTLIRKTFNINNDVSVKTNISLKNNTSYTLIIKNMETITHILQATKLSCDDMTVSPLPVQGVHELKVSSQLITQNTCCKRAFIRGAFLVSGSMSNPKKAYHLEVVVSSLDKAEHLREMITAFSIDAKIVMRKKNYVVYIKEGSQIVDFLNVVEAHIALMNLENVRILKEMRNSINRQVNCEAANINKTVTAATKQIEDIIYIRDHVGYGDLSEGLEDIAKLRVEYPEASLKELGAMLLPPIGKSGVNHRLRKLSMIADHLRELKEENSHDNEGNSH
ncbi:DNA-binding protein WhiA [Lachnospiraceae bacterium MD1]|jgi:DNA-binding protein WhiA|uniref:Probable cell division protein WhiA n=1 Tax=Variimorphobacter saccharofermentans TaxID=2755051 RepID=A0A839K4Q6_9FIRM|nr:DNA-binding protein WhiA [Variimorphobacter saccharofermentans]MBB2184172.1 DNA-binding protein WhiA [Variimorphobacter saccharofermentans]